MSGQGRNSELAELETWIHRHSGIVCSDEAADGQHITDESIALAFDRARPLAKTELDHLARCAECRAVIAGMGRVLPEADEYARGGVSSRLIAWPRSGGGGSRLQLALAGAAIFVLAFVFVPKLLNRDDGGYALRGREDPRGERAEVALIATARDGTRRDLEDGGKISRSSRLGFVYGNLAAHHTLVILGKNAGKVRYYYPERAGAPPLALEKGPDVRGVRLPFDIALEESHELGELVIVAAFDATVEEIERALADGATNDPKDQRRRVFRLEIVE